MCGIVGFVNNYCSSNEHTLRQMLDVLNHRGPDSKGFELLNLNNVQLGMGHSRLSILDLSVLGNQPMSYKDLKIIYNGEVYNFVEVKDELRTLGHSFVSETDTEVILHAYEQWGRTFVNKFIGMFAIVIFDFKRNELVMVRDRGGVKPIYYYQEGDTFLFASELKAFYKHPEFRNDIDLAAVLNYFDLGFVGGSRCIYKNVKKLELGHLLIFNLSENSILIEKYWSLHDHFIADKFSVSFDVAAKNVEYILNSSLEYRLVSDVPVGVFLSGGYDSVAIASIIQSQRANKIDTFTVGFQRGIDESKHARKISNYIGTKHHDFVCGISDIKRVLPILPFVFDEPFADTSAIPMILLSEFAKQSVSVTLSGDGGDELFGGYSLHKKYRGNLKVVNAIPKKSRICFSKIIDFCKLLNRNNKVDYRLGIIGDQLKVSSLDPYDVYNSYTKLALKYRNRLFDFDYLYSTTESVSEYGSYSDVFDIPLGMDYHQFMQGVLMKVDRASMNYGLESREPFLDHRLVEYVAQLPSNFKYNSAEQKVLLKHIVHKYVPKDFMITKKNGFTPPIYQYLKSELRPYLNEKFMKLESVGMFNVDCLRQIQNDFLKNKLHNETIVWKLIQFEEWYNIWIRNKF
jgi:asparagine synthase (glutamine-hydrolysing)